MAPGGALTLTTMGVAPERVSPHDDDDCAPSKSFEPDDALRSVTVRGARLT